LSISQLKEMRKAAEKAAKEHGKTLFEICLEWIYDEGLSTSQRMHAWKLYADKMIIAVSEGGEADVASGPAIYLPEASGQAGGGEVVWNRGSTLILKGFYDLDAIPRRPGRVLIAV